MCGEQWLRLRVEGGKTTPTLKQVTDATHINGTTEIEVDSEDAVRKAAADLGLDYTEARFGSVDMLYKSETNSDILAEPTLLFAGEAD